MQRPNILLIHTDQQRWDALGANGNSHIQTPNLDRLAAQGVNFNRCFCQHPLCMPSRVSLLSGQYPSTLGISHMAVPVPPETMTLPRMLRQYGYDSACLGKLHFLPHANRDHRTPYPDYGFDRLEISEEPGVYEDAYRAWVRHKAPEQLDALSVGLPPATAAWQELMGIQDGIRHPQHEGGRDDFAGAIAFPGADDCTHSAFVADRTLDFLSQQDGNRPFFCFSGFFAPHAPMVAPQRFLDLYDPAQLPLPEYPLDINAERAGDERFSDERLRSNKQGYYAMVSEVDYYVGRILKQLEAQGLADNTIVLFISDHGEWLGDHLRYAKGYPADDSISRVPCMIRWPAGLERPGRTETHLVEELDLLPTLLDCAGIQSPPHLQGRSLYPLLKDADAYRPRRSSLTESTGWKTLRSERYRYLLEADGSEQLWDIEHDPGEYANVSADPAYADILAEHRRLLLQHVLEAERPIPRTWPY